MDEVQLSKKLSWLLRHGADETGLTMDAAGWVPVDEVLHHLKAPRSVLEHLVATNSKRRLELTATHVRACQGHSIAGMPITLEGLESSWVPYPSEGSLWHGTTVESMAAIAREGLRPQKRTHVHLAPSLDSSVGKRSHAPVVLEVSAGRLRAAGLGIYQAGNGVVLVRAVPPGCIVGLTCLSRAARAVESELRARFGW